MEECKLDLAVAWLNLLVDLKHLRCKLLLSKSPDRTEMFRSKRVGLVKFLKVCRSRSAGSVISAAGISLPVQVQIYMLLKYNLRWRKFTVTKYYIELLRQ